MILIIRDFKPFVLLNFRCIDENTITENRDYVLFSVIKQFSRHVLQPGGQST